MATTEEEDLSNWFENGLYEYDPAGILEGTCSVARVTRFSFLARACEAGHSQVVKALALPPYSLPKDEWAIQDESTSANVCYICAFSFCYSPEGQHLLKEIVKPPWSFSKEEILRGSHWCFMFDNVSLFEALVGDASIPVSLQEVLVNYDEGLAYVQGSTLLRVAAADLGSSGPLFDDKREYGGAIDERPMKLARFALKRRGYALFIATRAWKNPDSPLALLSTDLVGKIANLMMVDCVLRDR